MKLPSITPIELSPVPRAGSPAEFVVAADRFLAAAPTQLARAAHELNEFVVAFLAPEGSSGA